MNERRELNPYEPSSCQDPVLAPYQSVRTRSWVEIAVLSVFGVLAVAMGVFVFCMFIFVAAQEGVPVVGIIIMFSVSCALCGAGGFLLYRAWRWSRLYRESAAQ